MARWTPAAYGALVIVGTLNREMTGLLLVLSWLALRPRAWRWAFGYALIVAAIYGALVLRVGDVAHPYTPAHVWADNTAPVSWHGFAIYGGLLLPLLGAGVLGWPRADPRLSRLNLVVLAVYLPLWAALGIWQETRLLMPVLILFLPTITKEK